MWFGLTIVALWAVCSALWFMMPNASADIYDFLIVRMTANWYKAVLERLEADSRLLDVGVGTATALARNKELVLKRRVTVIGIDYERTYINKAAEVVAKAGLGDLVKVHCLSIYEPGLRSAFAGKAKFDAAYFSGSLTLMPDPPAALKCAASMLKPGGKVYVTQCAAPLAAPDSRDPVCPPDTDCGGPTAHRRRASCTHATDAVALLPAGPFRRRPSSARCSWRRSWRGSSQCSAASPASTSASSRTPKRCSRSPTRRGSRSSRTSRCPARWTISGRPPGS